MSGSSYAYGAWSGAGYVPIYDEISVEAPASPSAEVEFSSSRFPTPSCTISPTPVQETLSVAQSTLSKAMATAIESSLATGVFVDCCFNLYSHRAADGSIDHPRTVYANSEVLKGRADYFQSLFEGGFSESMQGRGHGCRMCRLTRTAAHEYEYESDSDLEDDMDIPSLTRANTIKKLPKASTLCVGSDTQWSDHFQDIPDGTLQASSDIAPYSIDIPDVAFRTFRAFVYYAYTGDVHFTPLRSIRRYIEDGDRHDVSSLSCSPKSLYRLADMYGMTELRELAAANIRQQLTENPDIAMNELLSSFTAWFPEVMVSQADLVSRPRRRLDCLEDLQDWADIVASGEQPHAGAALTELLRKLANA